MGMVDRIGWDRQFRSELVFVPAALLAISSVLRDTYNARRRAVANLERALTTVFVRNYAPMRFTAAISTYVDRAPRAARLDLPFAAADYDGAWLPPA